MLLLLLFGLFGCMFVFSVSIFAVYGNQLKDDSTKLSLKSLRWLITLYPVTQINYVRANFVHGNILEYLVLVYRSICRCYTHILPEFFCRWLIPFRFCMTLQLRHVSVDFDILSILIYGALIYYRWAIETVEVSVNQSGRTSSVPVCMLVSIRWRNALELCLMVDSLRWRHNGRDGVSNHRHLDGLLNRLFKRYTKAPRRWPLWGEFTGDRWIPSQRANDTENVSIWLRHHVHLTIRSCILSVWHLRQIGETQTWYLPFMCYFL